MSVLTFRARFKIPLVSNSSSESIHQFSLVRPGRYLSLIVWRHSSPFSPGLCRHRLATANARSCCVSEILRIFTVFSSASVCFQNLTKNGNVVPLKNASLARDVPLTAIKEGARSTTSHGAQLYP